MSHGVTPVCQPSHVTEAQVFHHERVEHRDHRGLKMVEKVRSADNTEHGLALGGIFRDSVAHSCFSGVDGLEM